MAPQPPLIMVDNVFDRINLYPLATLSSATPAVGREVQYVADYRRERTYWQAGSVGINNFVQSDLGAGNSAAPNFLWIDRGHNIWGQRVFIYDLDTTVLATPTQVQVTQLTVPAQGTVGGDPTSLVMGVTEEGALYTLYSAFTPQRFHAVVFPDSGQALLTGVILGSRIQLSSPAGYSSVLDEDAGERSERSESSLVPGYEGADRTYSARKVELRLAYIGAAEYDAQIRYLRRALFEINQPAVVCMNYGTKPERAWLYKYRGKDWSSPTKGATRNVNIPLYEYGPLIR